MDKEYMRRRLPEEPPNGLLSWARKELADELGGEYCVFHTERVAVPPSLEEIMQHNDLSPRKTEWAAVCTCTDCYEEFITQKESGSDNILLVLGEDGSYYTVDPGMILNLSMGIEKQVPGDTFFCPCCGSKTKLIHRKKVRGGRQKQIMVATVQNIEGYTGIFYWMVWRTIDEDGLSDYGAYPKDAFILSEHGSLVRYSHMIRTGWYGNSRYLPQWKLITRNSDSIDDRYHDWGSINNQKVGAAIYEVFPDLEGTTGEKTGLIEYLKADGYRPVAYLKMWRKYRGLENLCKCGQAKIVAELISASYRYSYAFEKEAEKYIELRKHKPHEMLRLYKGEFKQVRKQRLTLTMDIMRLWDDYRRLAKCGSFIRFLEHKKQFSEAGLESAFTFLRRWADGDLDKLARYMLKQGLRPSEVGLLNDTREMAARLYGNRTLTNEVLWPQRLIETHDRISEMLTERDNTDKATQLASGFLRVREWYGHLEWTDGEFCVILPKNNNELVNEGRILRHCVGGHGKSHASGDSLIFFIRRYRRPERPYYTLNISMRGKPREIQLHGYGNERHGPNKEYTHKIPVKVRQFCDRWENEILLAWYAEQQKKQKEAITA